MKFNSQEINRTVKTLPSDHDKKTVYSDMVLGGCRQIFKILYVGRFQREL